MSNLVFADTNIFIHYTFFDELDWGAIAGVDDPKLCFAPIVIRELDDKKYSTPRAQQVITRIFEIRRAGSTFETKMGVPIVIVPQDRGFDFELYQLMPSVQDDCLIASMIGVRNQDPAATMVLITADLALSIRAEQHGLAVIHPPIELRVPSENPEAQRIRRLEEENRQLKNRSPKLALKFETHEMLCKVELPFLPQMSDEDVEKAIQEENKILPVFAPPGARVTSCWLPPNADPEKYFGWMDQYSRERQNYLRHLKPHLQQRHVPSDENIHLRTLKLEFDLSNDGSEPANDLTIQLAMPDGIEFLLKPPESAVGLQRPLTPDQRYAFEEAKKASSFFDGHLFTPDKGPSRKIGPFIPTNDLRKIEYWVRALNHYESERLDPVFFVNRDFEVPKPFQIEYRIRAANLPKEVVGKLLVKVVLLTQSTVSPYDEP